MSVSYKVIERRNLSDPEAPNKFYASAVSQGRSDIDRLSELMTDGSTLRQADIYAVVIALVNTIESELSQGKIVELGKLGSFSIGVNSTGSDTEEAVTSANIIRSKIRFRPGLSLRNMLKTLQYIRK